MVVEEVADNNLDVAIDNVEILNQNLGLSYLKTKLLIIPKILKIMFSC